MIAPEESAIRRVMSAGWWGQPKIHGHRAQIHIPADGSPCLAFNRQGRLHKEQLPASVEVELKRIFGPAHGWNTIDTEWIKSEQKIYVFDFLKREDEVLDGLSFAERYELLPRLYLSPHISTLPVFKTPERCLEFLSSSPPATTEGLVFRAASTLGFADSTIVRCLLG
jgi:ATP-dependent DNA ligase